MFIPNVYYYSIRISEYINNNKLYTHSVQGLESWIMKTSF